MQRTNRTLSFKWFAAGSLAMLLAACSPEVDHRGYVAKPGAFNQISSGMSKMEVEGILGSPSTTASVQFKGDSYYYITYTTEGRGFLPAKESAREVIAIRFDEQGQVRSFAQYGLEDGRIVDMNTRKTVVAGEEDVGFLNSLFMGVRNATTGPMLKNRL